MARDLPAIIAARCALVPTIRAAAYGAAENPPYNGTFEEQNKERQRWAWLQADLVSSHFFTYDEYLALPARFVAEVGIEERRGGPIDEMRRRQFKNWCMAIAKAEGRREKAWARLKEFRESGAPNVRKERAKALKAIATLVGRAARAPSGRVTYAVMKERLGIEKMREIWRRAARKKYADGKTWKQRDPERRSRYFKERYKRITETPEQAEKRREQGRKSHFANREAALKRMREYDRRRRAKTS